MKNLIIFFITVFTAFGIARILNQKLEDANSGSSLQSFKTQRLRGIQAHLPQPLEDKYNVLVFGDSLLELLFEPSEFDGAFRKDSREISSYNLALRSVSVDDLSGLISLFPKSPSFDSCVIQIPALHFPAKNREAVLMNLWPGRGLSDYLNLWNPLSRLDHGFDSPANLWTGVISQETTPWNQGLRGGLNLKQSPHLSPLRESLRSPMARAKLNEAYNRVMGLSEYRYSNSEVLNFISSLEAMKSFCQKRVLVWPLFSSELEDRKVGPDPMELQRLKKFISEKVDIPIVDMPWDSKSVPFLDSQHIDPSFSGEFNKWLAEVI